MAVPGREGLIRRLAVDISEALAAGVPAPRIVIIGAGFGGLGMAIRLRQIGIDTFTILDKGDGVGGVWRDNSYPGAACDVPSHLYSFSFAPKPDWSRKFAPQAEILQYLEDLTDREGLRPHLRLGTEVLAATWDDDDEVWRLQTSTGEALEADVVVCGLGQLNRPYVPELPGLDRFEGTTFHSARWDHDHDLTGERVAVVGSGASAIQLVPEIAPRTGHLTLLQRSPSWIVPKRDRRYSALARRAFAHVPGLDRLYRWLIYWLFEWRFTVFRRNSRLARLGEQRMTAALEPLVSDELPRQALIPDHPMGCKRLLQSNDWYETLRRSDVTIDVEAIEEVTPTGIRTTGRHHDLDTIIFATGFRATDFLAPVHITGRGGVVLEEVWRDGAEAYLGLAVAGFPNLFLLYGPNTNLGHNSIVFMLEAQIHWVLQVVSDLVTANLSTVEVRAEAMHRYNAEVQRDVERTVWAADCRSWYKTESGKVTNNWPHHTVEYWRRTRRPRPADLERWARR